MGEEVDKVNASRARWAYEALAAARGWKRPDGTKIPQWNELSLNAQWRCGSIVEVLLHFQGNT